MAAAQSVSPAAISLDEYLHTSYQPDCDFVDGVLEERTLEEFEHSTIQAELIYWFRLHQEEWSIRVKPELRTRVSEERVRVSDISVLKADAPRERVTLTPPLLAIEILSPEDRIPRVIRRLNDFLTMGIQHLWLINPLERVAFTYARTGLRLVDSPRLTIPDSPIYLDLPELFAALD